MIKGNATVKNQWPDYRTIWRWHFYAGLFSIPFVLVLSASGAVYLFKDEIEAWLDRPYDNLSLTGGLSLPSQQIQAALSSVPGSSFEQYELPRTEKSAARVIVRKGVNDYRVYVQPATLQILSQVPEDQRLMRQIFRLHGELWMGNWGSYLVEIAASWTIVLIVTGIYLWWPRSRRRLAGVLYPRLHAGQRSFWRDLHAVTGIWICLFALFLLLTGLPWAKFWGTYFRTIRQWTGLVKGPADWPVGNERARRKKELLPSKHQQDSTRGSSRANVDNSLSTRSIDLSPIDRLVPLAQKLNLPPPVVIAPPRRFESYWSIRSLTGNRPLRVTLFVDPITGQVMKEERFRDRHFLDKVVAIGIAAHEGRLFGWPNQVLGLVTAVGLTLICASAVVLWLRRREPNTLGAPPPGVAPSFSLTLLLVVAVLAIYLPLFGLSLAVVLAMEKLLLVRIPIVRHWLGLVSHCSPPS